jgi:hypothetical protein
MFLYAKDNKRERRLYEKGKLIESTVIPES